MWARICCSVDNHNGIYEVYCWEFFFLPSDSLKFILEENAVALKNNPYYQMDFVPEQFILLTSVSIQLAYIEAISDNFHNSINHKLPPVSHVICYYSILMVIYFKDVFKEAV